MKTRFLTLLVLSILGATVYAQNQKPIPVIEDRETAILKPLRLSGPRVGATWIPNIDKYDLSDFIQDSTYTPHSLITQFGWQFEWKYFETIGGSAGLFEIIPLIGGLEQGIFLPSLNMLVGYRDHSGFELGFGPNLSPVATGFVLAAGYTIQSQHMNLPINLALTPSRDSMRFSVLIGFTKRSS